MSEAEATRFVNSIKANSNEAKKLEALKDDPAKVISAVKEMGYDATPDEIRDAFTELMSNSLPEAEIEKIAAGLSSGQKAAVGIAVTAMAPAAITAVVAVAAVASACI